MMHGRHIGSHRRWLPAVLLSLCLVGVVIAAGAFGWVIASDSSAPQAQRSAEQTSATPTGVSHTLSSTPTSASGGSAVSEALGQCQALFARQVPVALAADASLDQWRLHIQAMNQLVAGKITLTQAAQYWNDTRIGAHRKAEKFQRLDAAARDSGLRCAVPPASSAGSRQIRHRLLDCQAATKADADAMSAARVTVATWEHHIDDMNAMRAGKITPAQATSMWVRSWHTGARQLTTYHHQAARALHRTCH